MNPTSNSAWREEKDAYTDDGVHSGASSSGKGKGKGKGGKNKKRSKGNQMDIDTAEDASVEKKDSDSLAVKYLKPHILLKVVDEFNMSQCIIFCRTQVDCDNLEQFLLTRGDGKKGNSRMDIGSLGRYSCVVLHSGRDQRTRNESLASFKDGLARFLICTDVAARGIDIQELPYCINMTLPDPCEEYIHRVGRVGRAESIGMAISLVSTVPEKVWYHTCKRKDRGRGCTNTDLVEEKGCTIWYDEVKLLEQIEKRLGGERIARLDTSDLKKGRENFIQAAKEGRLKQDPFSAASVQHVQFIQPVVQVFFFFFFFPACLFRLILSFSISPSPAHFFPSFFFSFQSINRNSLL